MSQGKNPAFMYYPKDWRADSVFSCSLAARGLWHEMMNMMHASERYGYLSSNGCPIPDESISRYCGCSLQEYQTLFAELERAGIPRRTSDGIIFSKRMVDDQKERGVWRKQKKNQRVKALPQNVHPIVQPMSARLASASPSPHKEKEGNTNTAPAGAPGIVPIHIWVSFAEMRRKKRQPLTDYAGELIRRKLQTFKDAGEDPVEILEQSIMNSWTGVFSLKKRGEVHGQKGKPTTSEVVQSFLRQINTN